jgi:nucleoid DNA-binding protein
MAKKTPPPAKSKAAPAKPAAKRLSKAAIVQHLAEGTELTKKQVEGLLDHLSTLIKKELSGSGAGEFILPGVVKFKVVRKPATPERQKPNPFKPGEMMTIKAQPAKNTVKARILKAFEGELG